MSLRQKAAKGIVWSVIQKWGREAVSFLTFVALSRLLDPEAFGLVALATAFTAFIHIFLDQGFSAAIVQRTELKREHLDTAFWISVLTGLLMAVAGIVASGLVASLYDEPSLAPVLMWLSIGFIFIALSSTQTAILRRKLAFKSLAARSLTATVVGGIVGVGMAIAGFGVWSLVGMNLARGLAGVIVLWRASDWRPGFHVSKKHYKELFSFGVSVTGNNVLKVLVRRSDDFLIGYFLGPTMLGFYTIGYRFLLMIIRLVTGIVNSVAFPTFSRIQHNPKRIRRAFYRVTHYTNLLAFPIFIGLALLASELIPALFGAEWTQSIPIMQILALSGILQGVLLFNGSILRATGKPSWQFAIMLVTAVCSVIGFLLAVRLGIVAVAAAFVIVGYLMAPISYIAVRKQIQIDLRTYLGQFALPLFATLIMILIIVGLKFVIHPHGFHPYFELFIYIAAGALTYSLVVGLASPSLFRQVINLASPLLPRWNLKGIFQDVL